MEQNVIEKAAMYAMIAHSGQVRKSEPDKPAIVHPMGVADILINYGADDGVVAAGLLHDVVEDTDRTLEDIEKNFGKDIAHLVDVASEPDKTKSWEERKLNKINTMRDKTLREKLVPTADKIHNIETMERQIRQRGYKDFTAFRRGEKQQEWFFRNMYFSLINGQDPENPLFKRLEKSINNVFERTMDEYLKNPTVIVDIDQER